MIQNKEKIELCGLPCGRFPLHPHVLDVIECIADQPLPFSLTLSCVRCNTITTMLWARVGTAGAVQEW